jgi:hypothetical protein
MAVEEWNVKKGVLKKGANWKFTPIFRVFKVYGETKRVVGKSSN